MDLEVDVIGETVQFRYSGSIQSTEDNSRELPQI